MQRRDSDYRERIGECAVDSGTLIFIDPCYVDEDDNFNKQEWLDALYPDEAAERTSLVAAAPPTVQSEMSRTVRQHTELRGGVLVSTMIGDGLFPVYRVMRGSRVLRFEILIEEDPDEAVESDDDYTD